ncbi:MAG: single-stranded-DNA-specific exonuclease RecJ [Calditerrivibrio sp.]|nr:single-stranded-DNA-specific exonuclease RecJ [Calditerrivibrio sp.]
MRKPEEIIEEILKRRGIIDTTAYLNPHPKYLEKSEKLISKDVAGKILNKLKKAKSIVIYSDYDVDGVTSSVLFSKFLSEIGIKNYRVVIPSRFKDGYGLNIKRIEEEWDKDPFDFLITFDCGISSRKEVEYLRSKGVFVVITDHHLPLDDVPNADIIINPKLTASADRGDYYLCGCGVAFKLIHMIKNVIGNGVDLKKYLDLVALATVADIVPLVGDNRILVKYGLDVINSNPSLGVKSLMAVAGLKGDVGSYHLGFVLGPRINASGRLDIADTSYHLLVCEDETDAKVLASKLDELNEARKKECDEIFEEAISMMEETDGNGICLYQKHWNKGVIGIVASRLVERYNTSVILFGTNVDKEDDNGIISGSGRTADGVDLFGFLSEIDKVYPGLMIKYGGHTKACGLSVYEKNFEKFKSVFHRMLKDVEFSDTKVSYDLALSFSDLNERLVEFIKKMEPFGYGNENPRFLFKNVELLDFRKIGTGEHLSLNLQQNGQRFRGVWFNGDENRIDSTLDIVANLDFNEYNGNRYIQLKVVGIV